MLKEGLLDFDVALLSVAAKSVVPVLLRLKLASLLFDLSPEPLRLPKHLSRHGSRDPLKVVERLVDLGSEHTGDLRSLLA